MDAHMATISSEEENAFIYNIVQSHGYQEACFGYSDEEKEGEWKWLNGEPKIFEKWAPGEPNNVTWDGPSKAENFACFHHEYTNGSWNDVDPQSFDRPFVCEWDYIPSGFTPAGKKALYFLPGYPAAKLYSRENPGEMAWFEMNISNLRPLQELLLGPDLLRNDDHGGSIKVREEITDDYGVLDAGKEIMDYLKSNFDVSNGGEYKVIFYPYNWLDSLVISAAALETHINDIGQYDKVIFVTHSTGGLLASTYLARSTANKSKVERVIMIAPPLAGTYAALEPIETGVFEPFEKPFNTAQDALTVILIALPPANPLRHFVDGASLLIELVRCKVRDSLKTIIKNDPTAYQLLPSQEYIRHKPLIFESWLSPIVERYPTTKIAEYYSFLNMSGNINPNLTNGPTNSHRVLREEALKDGLAAIFDGVKCDIIRSYGLTTPSQAVYVSDLFGNVTLKTIVADKTGDGTVQMISTVGALQGPFLNATLHDFKGLEHTEGLTKDQRVFDRISNIVNGVPYTHSSALPNAAADTEDGMTKHVKLDIKAAKTNVDIYITDRDSNVAAEVVGFLPQGFDKINFSYTPLVTSTDETSAVVYLPREGYRVTFSRRETDDVPVDLEVKASTLDFDGFNTGTATYSASATGANGEILTLDMSSMTVDTSNLGSLVADQPVTPTVFYSRWEIEDTKTLNVGTTSAIALSGADVDAGNVIAADLGWSSSNPEVASVSENGEVTTLTAGEAVIFAVAQDESYRLRRSIVTVTGTSSTPTSVTVTFDSQSGSFVPSSTVAAGSKVSEPTAPTRSGYTFGGWYRESSCQTAWNFNSDTVNGNITLYAKWTPSNSGGKSGGGGGCNTGLGAMGLALAFAPLAVTARGKKEKN
jgi:uncharacterized repeat protein (TIGR02543 family)